MFLYNSLLLLCSAVSKYQNQHDWEGRGLCPASEGVWGMVGAGRAEPGWCCPSPSATDSPALGDSVGQCPPDAPTTPVSFQGDRGSAQGWQRWWLPLHTLTQTPPEM